jgi:hypothetical protein
MINTPKNFVCHFPGIQDKLHFFSIPWSNSTVTAVDAHAWHLFPYKRNPRRDHPPTCRTIRAPHGGLGLS